MNGSQGVRAGPVPQAQAIPAGDAEVEEAGEESDSNGSIDLENLDDLSNILGLQGSHNSRRSTRRRPTFDGLYSDRSSDEDRCSCDDSDYYYGEEYCDEE